MRSTGFLRFFTYFSIVMTMILGAVLGGTALYYGTKIDDFNSGLSGILIVMFALLIANAVSIWTRGILFIHFVSKSTDEELIENRWALIVLSLGVGSIFMVSILTRFTGGWAVSSNKEKNPVRYLIGKWQSLIGLLFGAAGLASFALFTFVSNKNLDVRGMDIYFNNVLDTNASLTKVMLFLFVGFFAVSAVVGMVSVPLFYQRNSLQKYNDENSSARKVMVFFATLYNFWVTILLLYAMLSAVLELFQAIGNAFGSQHESWFERMFAILMLPLIFYMQMYILETCAETLKGIWSKADQVSFNEYKNLYQIQHPSQKGNMNR